ncbi:gp28 [Escherichia phage phiEB49]|uniref:Gp28 n=1 Tax=Escherichia phage phiEB49 TaxID=1048207 RepID=F8UBT8_9CAUD|nr:exonuclease VIII [Escherichia phage phiEB49]AEI91228.1 gp28 [Escherichia phage phiEB49]
MSFKVYTNDELTNEAYHQESEHVSGSGLAHIFSTCPAAYKFAEHDDSNKALKFGTCAHTCILENSVFDATYYRQPAQEEFEDLITSKAALATRLKSMGIAGTSGKDYPELMEMLALTGESLNVWWDIQRSSEIKAEGREIVSAKDFDTVRAMREVLCGIPAYNAIVNSETAQRELSIFGEINECGVKVRLDHVDVVGDTVIITDFKTTSDASPEGFGRLAANYGYLLKMSLQRDLFVRAFNEKRRVVVQLLAQEKKAPYLPMLYTLSDAHIALGRRQYMEALATYKQCKKFNVWPGYNAIEDSMELQVPSYYMSKYENSTNS